MVDDNKPKDAFFYDFHTLVADANSYFCDGIDNTTIVPTLESDYALVITHNIGGSKRGSKDKYGNYVSGAYQSFDTDTIVNNAFRSEKILVQTINNGFTGNGINAEKSFLGLNTYTFNFQQNFSITYIAKPYLYQTAYQQYQFTSYIHFLYKRQLSPYGTLRLATKNFILPTILLYNIRTNKPVMLFKKCKFSLPKFNTNPQSNNFVTYDTTISFNDYDEFLDDGFELFDLNYKAQKYVDKNDFTYTVNESNRPSYMWGGNI